MGSQQVNLDIVPVGSRSIPNHYHQQQPPRQHHQQHQRYLLNQNRSQKDNICRYHADPICRRPPVPPEPEKLGSGKSTEIPAGLVDQKVATLRAASAKVSPKMTSQQHSSIVTKPARGWLHPDYLFAKDGINYAIRVGQQLLSMV